MNTAAEMPTQVRQDRDEKGYGTHSSRYDGPVPTYGFLGGLEDHIKKSGVDCELLWVGSTIGVITKRNNVADYYIACSIIKGKQRRTTHVKIK